VYRVDLRFESGLDPRASAGTLEVAGLDLDGRARAWSYRLVTENDPENEVRERGESVDLGNFEIVSPGPGEAAVVTDAYEVFVPDLLWQLPDLFDPDGSCEDPVYCAIGAWVRQRLGLVTVEARARTTSERSYLNVSLGYVRPDPSAQRVGVSELGRVSETGRSLFPILLGIEQEGSDQPRYWPGE
jgi:hypothetical protein